MCSGVFSAVGTKFVRIFFFMALWPNAGHGLHIHEVSRTHIQRRTTVGRTPLDEWSARHRDLYLTTHNTHKRKPSMPPAGFEPTISAVEWPQTFALDRATNGTGNLNVLHRQKFWKNKEIFVYTFHVRTSIPFSQVPIKVGQTNLLLNVYWGFFYWG